uniref:E3 ubiquitin-protein ligase RNF170 n=1 Tax=Parascaris univalens TaxID=6257 RepID=A0A915BXV5_PARUN
SNSLNFIVKEFVKFHLNARVNRLYLRISLEEMNTIVENQFFEGVENDVTLSLVALLVLAASSLYLFFRRDPEANRIHPTLEAAIDEFRRVFRGEQRRAAEAPTDGDDQPRQYGQDRTCPICYGPASFAVLTNCGHLFCCNCIYGYWRHSASLVTPVRCAVCRAVVSVLMPLPLEGEREDNIDEAVQSDIQLNEYNRRFSGEPRPLVDYIRDLPVLLPYMLRTLLSVNGLMWMFRIRVFLCLTGVLIYVLSPFDILPESALGVLGMLDDVFIAFVVLVYATVLFRQLMAGGRMRFGWE